MSRVITISARVLFFVSLLAVVVSDLLLPGIRYGCAVDTAGFCGMMAFGLLSVFSSAKWTQRLITLSLISVVITGWVCFEQKCEWLGYRLLIERHGSILEDIASQGLGRCSALQSHGNALSGIASEATLTRLRIHDYSVTDSAAAFKIDNDAVNSHTCLIYAPDASPSNATLYALGLYWPVTDPEQLANGWYYCKEAVN